MPKKMMPKSAKKMGKSMPKKGDLKKNGPVDMKSKKLPKEPKTPAFDNHPKPSQKPNSAMPRAAGSVKAYRKKK